MLILIISILYFRKLRIMKYISILALLLVVNVSMAHADEDDHHHDHHHDRDHEDKVQHYESEKVETEEKALTLLIEKISFLDKIFVKENVDGNGYEAIHQASYTLEAIVDRLRENADSIKEPVIDNLDESVQAIHYASEEHKEQETKEWFRKLKVAAEEVQNVY
jgi:hypothetical protein